ncbi:MAG: ATPase, T2SS/T4P/T4SS family [Actinomycetaceae bacterium]|nr:ATPase, T2SS/T4P/T4SS family [Actinomycetaceae bacterium]
MAIMTARARNDWVRRAVGNAGIDPVLETGALKSIIDESFEAHPTASPEDQHAQTTALLADIGGYGALQPYLEDQTIEEIYINSPSKVFIARQGISELTPLILTAADVRDLVERMLHHSGRRLDLSVPFVDAMLPGGERLHVVIPPVAGTDWSLNIRKHLTKTPTLEELVTLNTVTPPAAQFLAACVRAGLTVLISGATQSGKTTVARALAAAIPARERIVTCEEVFELNLKNRDCVAMQTRNANIEGFGEVTLRDLVRESLRMRPERIIIGEVRGAEALDMLLALNAGIPGLSTIHANRASEALRKLAMLPLLAGENVTSQFVSPTVAASIDLVVHLERDRSGHRYVEEIRYVSGRLEGDRIESEPLWLRRDSELKRTASFVEDERFERSGISIRDYL